LPECHKPHLRTPFRYGTTTRWLPVLTPARPAAPGFVPGFTPREQPQRRLAFVSPHGLNGLLNAMHRAPPQRDEQHAEARPIDASAVPVLVRRADTAECASLRAAWRWLRSALGLVPWHQITRVSAYRHHPSWHSDSGRGRLSAIRGSTARILGSSSPSPSSKEVSGPSVGTRKVPAWPASLARQQPSSAALHRVLSRGVRCFSVLPLGPAIPVSPN
jgi:hypothetical protein